MQVKDVALLAADTVRTKVYLQEMIREGLLPEFCVVYTDHVEQMKQEADIYRSEKPISNNSCLDNNIPILYMLEEAAIPYLLIENPDINSDEMYTQLKALKQQYVIYSGYGGAILKPPLFQIGKKFLHVHAGLLPQYRGSTTAYYSLLQEGILGATAIFLNERLDEGEILHQQVFPLPTQDVDMDYIYEPFIRAQVLVEVLKQYAKTGELVGCRQKQEGAETYFIIHPVLKHLALLKLEKAKGHAI